MANSYLLGDDDTICGLATPQGRGGISVIRISGFQSIEVVRKFAAFLPKDLKSHHAYFGTLKVSLRNKKNISLMRF